MAMSPALFFKVYFVWFIFLAPIGFICINLSIGMWHILKRAWKKSEQKAAGQNKKKVKASHWKSELNEIRVASTE